MIGLDSPAGRQPCASEHTWPLSDTKLDDTCIWGISALGDGVLANKASNESVSMVSLLEALSAATTGVGNVGDWTAKKFG